MFIDTIYNSDTTFHKIYKKEFEQYKLFEREIFWFQKLELYNYFPTILQIDYIKKIIYFELKINNQIKDNKKQIEEILEILKINNCQLINLTSYDIVNIHNNIFIINMLWCIDLSIDINLDLNFWPIDENSSHIKRNNFLTNKFTLNNILKDNLEENLDVTLYLIYLNDYTYFLKFKNKIIYYLNKFNIIVVNKKNNIDKVKNILSKLKKNRNYEIILSEYQNILEDNELLLSIINKFKIKYVCNIYIDKDYENCIFSNLHFFERSINLIKEKNNGLLIRKQDISMNGIFGDLEYIIEIKNFCLDKQIDFRNYISDINNLIDWKKYQQLNRDKDLKTENDSKIHWISNGLDQKIYLPLKEVNNLGKIPLKLIGNNFIINIEIFNNIIIDLKVNEQNKKALSQFLMYILNYYNKETIIIDE